MGEHGPGLSFTIDAMTLLGHHDEPEGPGRELEATSPEFDPETVPWLDRCYAEIALYVDSLEQPPAYDLREKLIHWLRHGFVVFEQAIDHSIIDRFLQDVDELMAVPHSSSLYMTIEGYGARRLRDFPLEALAHHHSRLMDFHNQSEAGKHLALNPVAVDFLSHVFRSRVVAMQSLTFMYSTEQDAHQDFAYVTAEVPSHLAATWIALEDAHPDAGPLFYYEGSHTVRKFDWGNGLVLTAESTRDENEFASHLRREATQRGYVEKVFCPRKGDMFFWHAGLVHGGSPVRDPALTRKSFVTHYSTEQAYRRDRRTPNQEPVRVELNGGILFADSRHPDEEDRFRLTSR